MTTTKQANAPTLDADLTLLLGEWARTTLASGSWNDALVAASGVSIFFSVTYLVYLILGFEFTTTRFSVYRAICERLEAIDRITDAAECFHKMENELGWKRHDEEAKWITGE